MPRLALGAEDAAGALGVSRRTFYEHIAGEIPCIYVGRLRLWRVSQLERWAEAHETSAFERR